jgi:ADP-ribose pyrophosphatase YjhB (NUDIX family)
MQPKRYVGVLVKSKDKVLLCKRNNQGSLPGEWSVPAGKVNQDESTIDGARREFFEETGIDIDDKELNLIGVIKRYNRDGEKIKGLMYVYQLDSDKKLNPDLENALDGEEHTECGYFTIDNLPEPIGEQLEKLIKIIL